MSGTRDFKTCIDLDDLEVAELNFCKRRDVFGCRSEFSTTLFPGIFPGLGAGREKALASAGHVPDLHPEILGVIN